MAMTTRSSTRVKAVLFGRRDEMDMARYSTACEGEFGQSAQGDSSTANGGFHDRTHLDSAVLKRPHAHVHCVRSEPCRMGAVKIAESDLEFAQQRDRGCTQESAQIPGS